MTKFTNVVALLLSFIFCIVHFHSQVFTLEMVTGWKKTHFSHTNCVKIANFAMNLQNLKEKLYLYFQRDESLAVKILSSQFHFFLEKLNQNNIFFTRPLAGAIKQIENNIDRFIFQTSSSISDNLIKPYLLDKNIGELDNLCQKLRKLERALGLLSWGRKCYMS